MQVTVMPGTVQVQAVDLQDEEQRLLSRLADVQQALAKKRDEWVLYRARIGIEERWRECQLLYEGEDLEPDAADRQGLQRTLTSGPRRRDKSDGPPRSKVAINIVRDKVDTQVAKHCRILLPSDGRNWGMRPTPVPELADQLGSNEPVVGVDGQPLMDPAGNPMTKGQVAQSLHAKAQQACAGMQEEIEDNLVECGFNGEERKLIAAGVKLGTGILKGPAPMGRESRSWQPMMDGIHQLVTTNVVKPGSQEVPCWNVYPDPAAGRDVQNGSGIFERRPNFTRKMLRRLVGLPGFIDSNIEKVLAMKPTRVTVAENACSKVEVENGAFEAWEYHGEIDCEDMHLLSTMAKDPLTAAAGVLVMINEIVIGAMEPFTPGSTIPYDFWCWRERDDMPWGDGLPLELRSQQKVVTAAWRMAMDAGRNSSGPLIAVNRAYLHSTGGQPIQLGPNSVLEIDEENVDIQKVVQVMQLGGGLKEMQAIVQMAMEVAERETNTPALMQGQQGAAPDTLGGQLLAVSQASEPTQLRVRRFDDNITRPHIGRYYDYHMARTPKPEIKGDFETDARGSTELIDRDVQNMQSMQLMALVDHPRFGPHFKDRFILERMLSGFFKMSPKDALKEESVVEEEMKQQQPQPDPKVQVAQIGAQVKEAELADRKEERQFRAQVEMQNAQERQAQINYNQQREQAEFQLGTTQIQNERDIAFAKLAQERNLTVEQLQRKWGIEMLKIDTQRQIFNAEQALGRNIAANV